jgi:hypothetical protein
MVQPGVTEDNSQISKVGDKKRLDLFSVALLYPQFNVSLDDSSFVFRPVHVIDFSWLREERCLDFESFGKSPVDEVFGGPAVYEGLLFSRSV